MEQLSAEMAMGTVDLLVRDLEGMTAYYREGVGMDLLEQAGGVLTLGQDPGPGAGPIPILRLTRNADLPGFHRGHAGLFHTAILGGPRPGLKQ